MLKNYFKIDFKFSADAGNLFFVNKTFDNKNFLFRKPSIENQIESIKIKKMIWALKNERK